LPVGLNERGGGAMRFVEVGPPTGKVPIGLFPTRIRAFPRHFPAVKRREMPGYTGKWDILPISRVLGCEVSFGENLVRTHAHNYVQKRMRLHAFMYISILYHHTISFGSPLSLLDSKRLP
jgi:hypothetical protein